MKKKLYSQHMRHVTVTNILSFLVFTCINLSLVGVCGAASHSSRVLRGDGHQASEGSDPLRSPGHRWETIREYGTLLFVPIHGERCHYNGHFGAILQTTVFYAVASGIRITL